MNGSDDYALVIDALGQRCPLPVIALAARIGDIAVGQQVAVLSDDEAAVYDIPAWCRMRRHTYVEGEASEGRAVRHVVRRLH